MRNFTIFLLLLCAVIIFAVPPSSGNAGIKVIEVNTPAPKGDITFDIISDSYIEESKQIKYEEYGITWIYTIVKLDVFKSANEIKQFYKLHNNYTEKTASTGEIIMTTGNKADFRLISIFLKNNFCLVTLEHVRPTPDAIKSLRILNPKLENADVTVPNRIKTEKPKIKNLNTAAIITKNIKKPAVVIRKKTTGRKISGDKKSGVKKTKSAKIVKPNIKITNTNPIPIDIMKSSNKTGKVIPSEKKPAAKMPSGVKKVNPDAMKQKVPEKNVVPYFEG